MWWFDRGHFSLCHAEHSYHVQLDRCRDSANVLDWIMQSNKAWATPADIGNLVLALTAILQPQFNMCRDGRNVKIDPRKVAASNGYS